MASQTATTGEIRLLAEGVQVGDVVTIPEFVITNFFIGPDIVTGPHMGRINFEVQARVTAGTEVAVGVRHLEWVEPSS